MVEEYRARQLEREASHNAASTRTGRGASSRSTPRSAAGGDRGHVGSDQSGSARGERPYGDRFQPLRLSACVLVATFRTDHAVLGGPTATRYGDVEVQIRVIANPSG